jgi:peptidoglycan/xylan/chitin deacetylase (PgdA/CDA1 family)
MSLLKAAKQAVLRTAGIAGALALARNSSWRSARLLILCYHGISKEDEHEWNPGLYMTPALFRRRMELLRCGGYRVLPLDESLRLLSAGKLPPKSVTITFDDGAHDFHALAFPILKEFGYPATLYLTTYYCLHQLPVFDVVSSYVLWKGRERALDARGLLDGAHEPFSLANGAWRTVARTVYEQVRRDHLSADGKDALAEEIARRLGVDYQSIRDKRLLGLMRPEEVRDAARNGISIELHTHRHRTPRDRGLFEREIADNRRGILEMTGRDPRHFCYPSGDYVPEFFSWLRECGVRSATTCVTGLAGRDSNPYELPRLLDVETLSEIEFESWLAGFSVLLPMRAP